MTQQPTPAPAHGAVHGAGAGAIRVGVLGASGYGGAELLRRLSRHPHVRITGIGSRQYEGRGVGACWPQFRGDFPDLAFTTNEAVVDSCDVLFCATPHGTTAPLVRNALEAGRRVVDLSADFRLHPDEYAEWYAHEHPVPDLYDDSVYGLVELHRHEIAGARLVANPGCYPTAAALALAPLAARGLLGRDVVVNAASGVSGAGRTTKEHLHFTETNENFTAYGVAGTHRHTAEIENTLGRARSHGRHLRTHDDFDRPLVTFTPHLVPMTRGILASCSTRPDAYEGPLDDAALLELYREYYAGEPLVVVQEELPQTKAAAGSDRAFVSVRFDARTGIVLAFAAIDNLGKGAAGQAVHNFNVMMGLPELDGLELHGMWP